MNSTEIEAALAEWRDAREAIFGTPFDLKVTPDQFARLAIAEHALMGLARMLKVPDGSPTL